MDLNFYHPKKDESQLHKIIRETIEFQKSYEEEEYRSKNWKDYDLGYIEWLKFALEQIEKHPQDIIEKIVYRDIISDHVVVRTIYVKKYVSKDWKDKKGWN